MEHPELSVMAPDSSGRLMCALQSALDRADEHVGGSTGYRRIRADLENMSMQFVRGGWGV